MERHFALVKEQQERKLVLKSSNPKYAAAANEYKQTLENLKNGFEKGTLQPIDALKIINKILDKKFDVNDSDEVSCHQPHEKDVVAA